MTLNKPLQWIRQNSSNMTDELTELCEINSGSDHLQGLLRTADWLEKYFDPIQVHCNRILLPSYRQLNDDGIDCEQTTGPALRWDWPDRVEDSDSDGHKRLLLTIHYDTVYGRQHPFQHCKRTDANRLIGPGVIDAKGGIVILRYAALAASRFLSDTSLRFSIILTPDEEIGSPASCHLWNRISKEFSFALLFEPSMSDGSWVSTRKGTGTFVFQVRGIAAHSGRNFQAGRNAIVHASRLIRDLHELNGVRENATVNVGRIRGGDAINVVPDLTVVRVNVRISDPEDQAWLESQIQRIVERHDLPDSGYRVRVSGGIHSPPKPLDPRAEQWMRWVEEEGCEIGQTVTWKPSGGASDGNKLHAVGLPNIDTCGPDGDGLHSENEWIDLSSLPRKASLVFRLMARFAGHSITGREGMGGL
jgi:glutamate carboxypeptidase